MPLSGTSFSEDQRARAREAGRKSGVARRAKRQGAVVPYAAGFLTFRDTVGRGGTTRELWAVIWKAADGLPLTATERARFRTHTARQEPPARCRELWILAGRRSGKSENMMLRATWRAISRPWRETLSAGELGVIPVIASDRDQARNSLRYLKGLIQHPAVAPFVAVVKRDSVEFRTGAIVQVHTANWRATRGYTMLDVVLEECAFYQAEDSANPDEEVLAAIRPATLTVPDARIYGISSPYARRGILHQAHVDHWGREGDEVLVVNASTLALNPTVPADTIARELEADPARGASEYGVDGLVSFRTDVEALLSREAVAAVTVPGRHELAAERRRRYVAFVDPSGGSVDSFTLAIAHAEAGRAVLDLVRERRPPFSPDSVVGDFAAALAPFGLSAVTGDRYAGAWCAEVFRKHGITYRASERTKSDLYRELLPAVNAARVELLELPRLGAQLVALERRVAWGGKDSIDHPPGGHDDVANAAAGALVLADADDGVLDLPVDPDVPTLDIDGAADHDRTGGPLVPGEAKVGFRLGARIWGAGRSPQNP
jgi:hypothetical protein